MRNEITISKDDLHAVYVSIKQALEKLTLLLADLGCLHSRSYEMTTFVDMGKGHRKFLCPDCGKTIIESIEENNVGL